MSLNVALNVALSGLFANQTAIAATSENIANVNTADFSRRDVRFSADAIPDQFAGVTVDVVRSGVDRFVQAQGFSARGAAAGAALEERVFGAVEASLGGTGDDISFANLLGDAFAALIEVSAAPQSLAARADALARLDDAFAGFTRTLDQIDGEITSLTQEIAVDIERVNALLADISQLNVSVPDSNGAQDLIDARLGELSQFLSFTTTRDDLGRVSVTAGNGAVLVDAEGFLRLAQSGAGPTTVSLTRIGQSSGAETALGEAGLSDAFSGGRLDAAARLITDGLPALQSAVTGAADGVAAQLNAVYAGNTVTGANTPTTDLLLTGGEGRFVVNGDLLSDPARFAVARPVGGGVGGINDGSGAGALAGVSGDASVDAAGQSVALIGSAARNASLAATSRQAISDEISVRIASEGGVNLDEELSNLIVFQRSFGANARVIAAVDELWETLLTVL